MAEVTEEDLEQVRTEGFAVVEGFLGGDDLAEAQEALWRIYPRPEDYFADPDAHPRFAHSQFHGLRLFPYDDWALDRLPVHPALVDVAERFLASTDVDLYKVELWAKYAGAVDYDQPHHRDFGNHSLVVPRRDGRWPQLTTFLLLSDVTEADGPTKVVPLSESAHVPLVPSDQDPSFAHSLPFGELFDREVAVCGPAGSLLLYRTDVLHRGSTFAAPGRSRFALLVDFQLRGQPWMGKLSWPGQGVRPGMGTALERMTPRQRELLGFPPVGHPYWDDQTVADVQARYPAMDVTPYQDGMRAR